MQLFSHRVGIFLTARLISKMVYQFTLPTSNISKLSCSTFFLTFCFVSEGEIASQYGFKFHFPGD